jgi:hypothetical protein
MPKSISAGINRKIILWRAKWQGRISAKAKFTA